MHCNEGNDRNAYDCTVPPSAPVVFATGATTSSVSLQWKVADTGNAPIYGYSLNFRLSNGEWEELEFSRRSTSHVLQARNFLFHKANKVKNTMPTMGSILKYPNFATRFRI